MKQTCCSIDVIMFVDGEGDNALVSRTARFISAERLPSENES